MRGGNTSSKEKHQEKSLNPQLWRACAGSMVQIPPVSSTVFYFPQGHFEHVQAPPDFLPPRVPPLILCRVQSVKLLADSETNEVFSKITLLPLPETHLDSENDAFLSLNISNGDGSNGNDKPTSFVKTLTQSDANQGGGFSVPRYCADTIFPPLNMQATPPTQTVIVKDIHGEAWQFRHIYRGTPRRHLLTTGWSTFVNQKKLMAGDSVVFLRSQPDDELCIGIRRVKRRDHGLNALGSDNNPNPIPRLSICLHEATTSKLNGKVNPETEGRVKLEAAIEAVKLAAAGKAFEVVYYPRERTPEFCVKAANVRTAMGIRWCTGMRFKMAFETQDSSRISSYMGTVTAAQDADPINWPNSPWRFLQVAWEEADSDLVRNVKTVSPWLVELVSSMTSIPLSPFNPRKRVRIPQPFDDIDIPIFPTFPPGFSNNGGEYMFYDPSGIQGARQPQQHFGLPSPSLLSDLTLNIYAGNTLQSPAMFFPGFNPRHYYHNIMPSQASNDISRSLTKRNPSKVQDKKKSSGSVKTPQFVLFGQPIFTEQQIKEKADEQKGKLSAARRLTWDYSLQGLESGHCKVFMESEDVGCTLDLSVIGTYQELYRQIAEMFCIKEGPDLYTSVVYCDANGVVKHAGDEPFSDFSKATKRLTIKMTIDGDNRRKTWLNGENGKRASI